MRGVIAQHGVIPSYGGVTLAQSLIREDLVTSPAIALPGNSFDVREYRPSKGTPVDQVVAFICARSEGFLLTMN
jgi:hypothetical protein